MLTTTVPLQGEWSGQGQITEFPGGSGGSDGIVNYLLKSQQCALQRVLQI